jgi:hypothetical protein
MLLLAAVLVAGVTGCGPQEPKGIHSNKDRPKAEGG